MRFENKTDVFRKALNPNQDQVGGVLTLGIKAVLGAHVISSVVIAAASTFADFFGYTNPSTVSTFFDVDGTTFVSC